MTNTNRDIKINVISGGNSLYFMCDSGLFLCLSLPIQMQCLTKNRHFSTILSASSKHQINKASNNYLIVNLRTNKISEISKEEYQSRVQSIAFTHIVKFYNLIGTIIVNSQPFLVVATCISQVANYIEYPIYIINDVQFLPYRGKQFQKAQQIEEENKIIQELKRNHINKHFYYSYQENITSSLQEQQSCEYNCENFNQFAWNKNALQSFRQSKINNCWTIPIIQGFVAEIVSQNKYFTFEYLSISRRSIHMPGTRFNSRGLDEEAHSSNFVQTEQIFKCQNNMYVHLSVRGSVPLFWKQIKVRSNINYIKDRDIDEETVVKQHYQQLQAKYKASITTINLLSKQSSPQKQLKYIFQALFSRNIKSPYLFFYLNQQIKDKKSGQTNVTKFVQDNQKTVFGQYPFTLLQKITKQAKYHQNIVPRINCLDCLDRTNVMMARISEFFLKSVQNFISNFKLYQDSEAKIQEKKIGFSESFMRQHINVWTALGNCISQIYCGTASVASHMTKKENNSIKTFLGGAIISLNRYINASTTDTFKQQCIDCFLGRRGNLSKTDYFNANIIFQKIKHNNIPIKRTLMLINICQQGQQSFQEFLSFTEQKCSMIVSHLQQVAYSQKWVQNFELFLSKLSFSLLISYKYEKCSQFSLVLIKNQTPKQFKYKFIQAIQIPLKSYGASAIFIQINNTIACFINCKLQSGYQNKSLRFDDFNQIHKVLLFQTYRNNLFKLCEFIFCAGDINLRLSNGIQKQFKFKNLLEQLWTYPLKSDPSDLIKQGLTFDEYPLLKKSKFVEYQQGDITFLPTYKISSKKGGYDKVKYPAWCDRILFGRGLRSYYRQVQQQNIKCIYYKRIQQNFGSTHKGVMGTFEFIVKEPKMQLKNQLIIKYLYD